MSWNEKLIGIEYCFLNLVKMVEGPRFVQC
jgi:hypothetical protein